MGDGGIIENGLEGRENGTSTDWLGDDAMHAATIPAANGVEVSTKGPSSLIRVRRSTIRTARDEDMDISDDDNENERDEDEEGGEEKSRMCRDREEKRFRELLVVARASSSSSSKVSLLPPPMAVVDGTIAVGSGVVAFDSDVPASSDENIRDDIVGGRGELLERMGIDGDIDRNGTTGGMAPSSIGVGLGYGSNRGGTVGRIPPPPPPDDASPHRFSGSGLGLGMQPPASNYGMGGLGSSNLPPGGDGTTMTSGGGLGRGGFGGNARPQAAAMTKDPNLGKWEKHTKGIGMRLLQKMGYEGRGGLGAKRRRAVGGPSSATAPSTVEDGRADGFDRRVKLGTAIPVAYDDKEGVTIKKGISRPVEVVVRPNGLGLGYGNFKEQTQLKVNKQIEAEVRGIVLPEDGDSTGGTKKIKRESSLYDGIDKSLLPSTESLLSGGRGSWRRGNKRAKRKIVNYQDILNKSMTGDMSNKMKIIDMRGSATVVSNGRQNADRVAPIGEELLHNVTLVLNTHEGQLRTSSYMVQSVERNIVKIESEIKEMTERKEAIKNRRTKMILAMEVTEEAEALLNELTSKKRSDMTSNEKLDFVMDSLERMFMKLYSNFTREERTSLKFESTLIPSIVTPLLDSLTSSTSPLQIDMTWMDHLASGIEQLCDTVGSDDEANALREIIIIHGIVPWVQSALSSSKWDPVRNVEGGLGVYEALVGCAYKSLGDTEGNEILKKGITDEVVQAAVLPKLLRTIVDWKPVFDDKHRIDGPLHLWILPWLPYINDDSLGMLLDNVRRNLTKTLSLLCKSVSNDIKFFRLCLATLCPWKKVIDNAAIFKLTSDTVSHRFARSLARVTICIEPADQDWEHLHVLFVYFEGGVMSSNDFISIVEGEVLPAWAHALYRALQQPDHNINTIKELYTAWKKQIFDPSAQICNGSPIAHNALRSDSSVCRYFFGGLKMIQAAIESNLSSLEILRPPHPAECNYRISSMHRSKERIAEIDDHQPSAENVRVRRQRRIEVSFQEVVEAFANQRGMSFHPKTGSNAMVDGKPVFMLGEHPVYFDKNVIFALRESEWHPTSLEHFAQKS
jgi:tuftelin-interacting protein 11